MFRIIVEERKRREMDPTLELLRACRDEATATQEDGFTRERLEAMLNFFETMSNWYQQIQKLPKPMLQKLIQMGGKG
jgi:DNA-binding transcriptional regulator GbsR (MarR family)